MKSITLNTGAAYYREWGRGEDPTVLVLHGWGTDSSQYEKLGPMLTEKGFHTVVPDLPGWGKTPAPEVAWNVSGYVEWVKEFVTQLSLRAACLRRQERSNLINKDHHGLWPQNDKIVLFGHSFGGRIAIKYAEKYPEDLRALILCAAAGIKMPETIKKRVLKILAKTGKQVMRIPSLNKLDTIARKALYRLAGSYDYMNAKGVMVEVLVKAVEEDLTSKLPSLEVPTLLLWGTEDRATPYKDGQTMARLIPGAKLITFDGERHNLPKHIPEKVVEEIIKYYHTR